MKTEVALNLQSATVRGVHRQVLTLREAPRRIFAVREGDEEWSLQADAGGYMRLAELAAVAASEPRALVYLPRGVDRPLVAAPYVGLPRVGILFVHHSAHFRGSDWRDLRRRLGSARPVHRALRQARELRGLDEEERRWEQSPETEPVDLAHHADTLIVTASGPAFRSLARALWGMATYGDSDHIHFMDAVTMRRKKGIHQKSPTPDVICHVNTRWQDEEEADLAYDYRWVYPGYGPFVGMTVDETIEALAENGWETIQRRSYDLVLRRPSW
jgi:hypothetical protein